MQASIVRETGSRDPRLGSKRRGKTANERKENTNCVIRLRLQMEKLPVNSLLEAAAGGDSSCDQSLEPGVAANEGPEEQKGVTVSGRLRPREEENEPVFQVVLNQKSINNQSLGEGQDNRKIGWHHT